MHTLQLVYRNIMWVINSFPCESYIDCTVCMGGTEDDEVEAVEVDFVVKRLGVWNNAVEILGVEFTLDELVMAFEIKEGDESSVTTLELVS